MSSKTTEPTAETPRVLGVIGGSSLFHAPSIEAALKPRTVGTAYGDVVCHVGNWQGLQLVFVQRHHADPDGAYRQPRLINFRALAAALQALECAAVVGVYSVGSMDAANLRVGQLIVPEDYFNPFDILHLSREYDAHIVPELHASLRSELLRLLAPLNPHDGGVYVQTSGPRFETKAEVRFFAQFGELLGMTGANEAELLNELRIPVAMLAIVDNVANGLGPKLSLDQFKIAQKQNAAIMEDAVTRVLDGLAAGADLLAAL